MKTAHLEDLEFEAIRPHLFQSWVRFLSAQLRPFHDHGFEPSLFITREILQMANYQAHFPHQLFSAASVDGSFNRFVTPAACLHVYADLAGSVVQQYATLGMAHCARYENGQWDIPYRRPDFHMLELVTLGDRTVVEERIREMRTLLTRLLTDLGFIGCFQPATDAFFLGEDEGAQRIQKLKGLKQEFVVDDGGPVALCSINNHEDFFGSRFTIRSESGMAHSCCVAFGIERLVAYSLKHWGPYPHAWPAIFIA